ncbi:hypothetical protein PsorP6_006755 [Peronosclerospora sorghi]|uniref:Uncharacterized protein n=1 Tax=Peronosclerospora sorghi TaxID=230839 RepID=A0ACC0W6Z4_9STRA|nr:hypothetical protein PsorP6_006755 [Peronosclerospora sorghi]
MPSLVPPSSPFSSVVSQATGVQSAYSRLLSSLATEESEDVETADLHSQSSSVTSSTTPSHSTCESCAHLETEFARAVLFVESYQGPHRILSQENSSLKKSLYAYSQQATVGPCPTTTPPVGLGNLEQSKWEKWRELGNMTKQEAMKRYTTVLDNLVDDWRRSASVRGAAPSRNIVESSTRRSSFEVVSAVPHPLVKKYSSSMFDRLPRLYEELGALQERIEAESKRRDDLEAHLMHFTRETRSQFNTQTQDMEAMRHRVESVATSLKDEVGHHAIELQQLRTRHQELAVRCDHSVSWLRLQRVCLVLRGWTHSRALRVAFLVFLVFRAWHFLRRRGVPHLLAQILVRWLTRL